MERSNQATRRTNQTILDTIDVALCAVAVSARVTVRHDGAGQTQLKVYEDDALLASTSLST